jgi:hypothetical protein
VRSGLVGSALLSLILVLAAALWLHARDPRLNGKDAARALQLKVGGGPYHCERVDKDETLGYMSDVDYSCTSVRTRDSGYFIGTDRRRITELEPSG